MDSSKISCSSRGWSSYKKHIHSLLPKDWANSLTHCQAILIDVTYEQPWKGAVTSSRLSFLSLGVSARLLPFSVQQLCNLSAACEPPVTPTVWCCVTNLEEPILMLYYVVDGDEGLKGDVGIQGFLIHSQRETTNPSDSHQALSSAFFLKAVIRHLALLVHAHSSRVWKCNLEYLHAVLKQIT